MKDLDVDELIARLKGDVDETIDIYVNQTFPETKVSVSTREYLHSVLGVAIKSKITSDEFSGIVIAGFGSDEIFPTLYEIRTDGIFAGVLNHELGETKLIGRNGLNASIVPFAQTEMVYRFMAGMDPSLNVYFRNAMKELLLQFGNEIHKDQIAKNPGTNLTIDQNVVDNLVRNYFTEDVKEFTRSNYIEPTMNSVQYLPKDELAEMAEALINLTSLKRRVSFDQETVGGPVDVAVISKGDGFVWIKRKDYFDLKLNAK